MLRSRRGVAAARRWRYRGDRRRAVLRGFSVHRCISCSAVHRRRGPAGGTVAPCPWRRSLRSASHWSIHMF